jgi:putative alpha-1,2-mannosidase
MDESMEMRDYVSYVNIKQGTFSEPRYSYGNTLPLVTAPFGMNGFVLQTKGSDGGWFYHPSHKQTEGIRLTHQPSPWVGDYGHLVFMPQSGEVFVTEKERSSGFTEINMNPAFMEIYFKRYRAKMGLAATGSVK